MLEELELLFEEEEESCFSTGTITGTVKDSLFVYPETVYAGSIRLSVSKSFV